jgi:adenine-specific DNA-methyltransferase
MHQEWLKQTVDRDDLTRHDKWLCMMWPRLVLLRELLRDDGAIFISIDYNEEAHLRVLMDEVFGEENYRNTFVVARVKKNIQEQTKVRAVNFGYNSVLFYARSERCLINPPVRKDEKAERWHAFDAPGIRPTMEYEVFGKHPPEGRHWMYSKEIAGEMVTKGELRQNPKTGSIQYLIPASDFTLLDTNWNDLQEYDSQWDFPNGEKNVELIKRIISMLDESDAITLDSFAGSGTTGHAVLALNAEDGGNRRFILIEQEDYADDLTAERIRRVIKGMPEAKDKELREGYGGSFSFFNIGDALNDERMLRGKELPSYLDLARYVFFTATGEQLDEAQVDESRFYLGASQRYEVYLLYQPSIEFLKNRPLNKDFAEALGPTGAQTRLIIASHKYLDDEYLRPRRIEFCQLPFAIYRFRA